jgi:hypothetical protein
MKSQVDSRQSKFFNHSRHIELLKSTPVLAIQLALYSPIKSLIPAYNKSSSMCK